jgi:disulfide bond formation protein DsbB
MKSTNEKTEIRFILFSLAIFLISSISAAGVATPYWEENPLKLAPGESTIVALSLQNMVGDEDLSIEAEISEEAEKIASFVGNNQFSVPLGSEDVPVEIKIEIPEDAEIGSSYLVPVSFKQVSSEEGGMLHVASAFTSKIPVEIVGTEESELYGQPSETNWFVWSLIILVILIILALIIFWKKKRSK